MIAEHYPDAWTHLRHARSTLSDLAQEWESLHEDGLCDTVIFTDQDGNGTVTLYSSLELPTVQRLTDLLRTCVDSAWSCLDSLIVETVQALRILKHADNPTEDVYFPVALTPEDYLAHLDAGCLNGVLADHERLVLQAQPFSDADDSATTAIRTSLNRLLIWETRLEAGQQVDMWIEPESPNVRVREPARVQSVRIAPAALLGDGLIVAHYTIHGDPTTVEAAAGSYIDLAFNDDTEPTDSAGDCCTHR